MQTIQVPQPDQHLDVFLQHCHRRRYPAKSTLIYAGDKAESLFFILKGSVTVLIEDDDGREMIIAYLNKGDFMARWGYSTITQLAAHGLKPRPSAKSPK